MINIVNVTPPRDILLISAYYYSKIVELEEELRVVGNNLKSLEVSEEKVCVRSTASEAQATRFSHLNSKHEKRTNRFFHK